eukprot:UC4_evm4s228
MEDKPKPPSFLSLNWLSSESFHIQKKRDPSVVKCPVVLTLLVYGLVAVAFAIIYVNLRSSKTTETEIFTVKPEDPEWTCKNLATPATPDYIDKEWTTKFTGHTHTMNLNFSHCIGGRGHLVLIDRSFFSGPGGAYSGLTPTSGQTDFCGGSTWGVSCPHPMCLRLGVTCMYGAACNTICESSQGHEGYNKGICFGPQEVTYAPSDDLGFTVSSDGFRDLFSSGDSSPPPGMPYSIFAENHKFGTVSRPAVCSPHISQEPAATHDNYIFYDPGMTPEYFRRELPPTCPRPTLSASDSSPGGTFAMGKQFPFKIDIQGKYFANDEECQAYFSGDGYCKESTFVGSKTVKWKLERTVLDDPGVGVCSANDGFIHNSKLGDDNTFSECRPGAPFPTQDVCYTTGSVPGTGLSVAENQDTWSNPGGELDIDPENNRRVDYNIIGKRAVGDGFPRKRESDEIRIPVGTFIFEGSDTIKNYPQERDEYGMIQDMVDLKAWLDPTHGGKCTGGLGTPLGGLPCRNRITSRPSRVCYYNSTKLKTTDAMSTSTSFELYADAKLTCTNNPANVPQQVMMGMGRDTMSEDELPDVRVSSSERDSLQPRFPSSGPYNYDAGQSPIGEFSTCAEMFEAQCEDPNSALRQLSKQVGPKICKLYGSPPYLCSREVPASTVDEAVGIAMGYAEFVMLLLFFIVLRVPFLKANQDPNEKSSAEV